MQLTKVCFCLLIALLPGLALAGSVASMTSEQQVQGPNGENYLESMVDCTSSSEDRVIWRSEAGGDWCSKELQGFCSRSKIRAAKKVCDREFISALEARDSQQKSSAAVAPSSDGEGAASVVDVSVPEAVETSASADIAPAEKPVEAAPAAEALNTEKLQNLEAQQRQLEIEKERLSVEQQRLELQRQQVELRKEELAIQREIEDKANQATQNVAEPVVDTPAPAPRKAEETQQPANVVKKNVLGM